MNRRSVLKTIFAAGALAVTPQWLLKTQPVLSGNQLHYIGLGNAGFNILKHFHRQNIKGEFTCLVHDVPHEVNRDIRCLRVPAFGRTEYHTSASSLTKKEFDRNKSKLLTELNGLFEPNQKYIVLAGLGGFIGTLLALEITQKFHLERTSFKSILSTPFSFEGTKRRNMALLALKEIDHLPEVDILDLESLRQDHDLKLSNCFEKSNIAFLNCFQST